MNHRQTQTRRRWIRRIQFPAMAQSKAQETPQRERVTLLLTYRSCPYTYRSCQYPLITCHAALDVFAEYGKSRLIQRVTRYLLLVGELAAKTSEEAEHGELVRIVAKVLEAVDTINARQREIECMSQCLQVQKTVRGLDRSIVEPHRRLLAQLLFRKHMGKAKKQ